MPRLAICLVLLSIATAVAQEGSVVPERRSTSVRLQEWAEELRQLELERLQVRRQLGVDEVVPGGLERLQELKIEVSQTKTSTLKYQPARKTLLISSDLFQLIDSQANPKTTETRWTYRRRVGGLLLGEMIAEIGGAATSQNAHYEALSLLEASRTISAGLELRGPTRSILYAEGGRTPLESRARQMTERLQEEKLGIEPYQRGEQPFLSPTSLEQVARARNEVLDHRTATTEQLANNPQAVFEAVKAAALELARENLVESPNRLKQVEQRLRALELEILVDPISFLELDKARGKVVMSSGFLASLNEGALDEASARMRPLVRKQVLALYLSESVAAVAQLPKAQWEMRTHDLGPTLKDVSALIGRSRALAKTDGLVGKRGVVKNLNLLIDRYLIDVDSHVYNRIQPYEGAEKTSNVIGPPRPPAKPSALLEEALPRPNARHMQTPAQVNLYVGSAELTTEMMFSKSRADDLGVAARDRLNEAKAEAPAKLARDLGVDRLLGYGFKNSPIEKVSLTANYSPTRVSRWLGGEAGTKVLYQGRSEMTLLFASQGSPPPGGLRAGVQPLDPRSTVQLTIRGLDASGHGSNPQPVRVALSELHELQHNPSRLAHSALGALLRRGLSESLRLSDMHDSVRIEVEALFDDVRLLKGDKLAWFSNDAQIDAGRVVAQGKLNALANTGSPVPQISEATAGLLHRALMESARVGDAETFGRVLALRRSTSPLLAEDMTFLRAVVGEAAAKAEAEETRVERRLARFRDANGRVDWKAVGKAGLFKTASSTGKFTLAMFLKELAVAAASQDRARLTEFFDFVATTDFYFEYGLFAAGAAAGEGLVKLGEAGARGAGTRFVAPRFASRSAYQRFLRKYVKPRFVSGVLRSNVALAAGLALPQLVRGEFDGQTFAVSFASLGISAALVQGALSRIPWVQRVRGLSALGGASKLARLGGWTYQAAELAVILVAGEAIEHWWLERSSLSEAREQLSAAAATLVGDGLAATTDAAREAAVLAYLDAWDSFREFLYLPLFEAQAEFHRRLTTIDRQARLDGGTLEKLEQLVQEGRFKGLQLEAFAQRHLERAGAKGKSRLGLYADSYQESFRDGLETIYQDRRRDGPLEFDELASLQKQGQPTAETLAAAFAAPHEDASRNRFQTYADQRQALRLAAEILGADLSQAIDYVDRLEAADRQLFGAETGLLTLDAPGQGVGIEQTLKRATDGE